MSNGDYPQLPCDQSARRKAGPIQTSSALLSQVSRRRTRPHQPHHGPLSNNTPTAGGGAAAAAAPQPPDPFMVLCCPENPQRPSTLQLSTQIPAAGVSLTLLDVIVTTPP